jgi:hypothetical protein
MVWPGVFAVRRKLRTVELLGATSDRMMMPGLLEETVSGDPSEAPRTEQSSMLRRRAMIAS